MNEYYPSYIKDCYEDKKNCPKCNTNKFDIKEKLVCSYLDECNKCSRMSLYGENQINNLNRGYISRSYYTEMCTCRNRNVYSKIIKCTNCIKCENCKEELMSWEFKNIKSINDNHLCNKCFKKINYEITENINY